MYGLGLTPWGFSFMKIQHFFDIVHDKSQKLFTPLLLVLIIVVLLKQLQLYDWIQNIYASCLPIGIGVGIAFLFQPLIDRLQQHVSAKISVICCQILRSLARMDLTVSSNSRK